MARFFKKLLPLSDGPLLATLMISLTAVITHGLNIPQLGYYYDDWYMLWSGASRGASSLIGLFSMDRPFMGVIYSVLYRMLRDSIPGWHLSTLLVRIAGALAFYWILCMAWPKLKHLFVLAGMIFVVFPGFLAEPNAATKINHLIGYGAALFSIAFTLQAVKASRVAWKYACIALSLLLMALYLWIYEYMIGLEVMRIALLYWMLWQGLRDQAVAAAKRTALAYIPYVAVIGAFLFWRVFIFESTRNATDLKGLVSDYQTSVVSMGLRLVFQVINDFFTASTFAWFVQPYHLLANAAYGEIFAAFLVAAVVVALAIGYIFTVRKSESVDGENFSPSILVGIGALITLAAVFPVVLLNRHIDLMDPYKGYDLHPSAGVIIMVIGILAMLKAKYRNTALVALLALSVATQSLNIQYWANFWTLENSMWWQLTWRAPDIQDDTLVMASLPDGFAYQQDYEIWGPINLIYRQMPLSLPHIQAEVLNQGTQFDALQGKYTDPYVRDIFLPHNFQNLLLISQPTRTSCIHVIDGSLPAYSTSERAIIEKVGGLSKIERIRPNGTPPTPPTAVFGPEPARGWCYYYQQAELARQQGEWGKISALYDSAVSAGLKAGDRSEYFVFVEGLVNAGRSADAQELAGGTIKENPELQYSLCKDLSSAPKYPDSYGYKQDEISRVLCK